MLLENTFHFFPKRFTSVLCIEIHNLIQYYVNWWHKNVQRKEAIVFMKPKMNALERLDKLIVKRNCSKSGIDKTTAKSWQKFRKDSELSLFCMYHWICTLHQRNKKLTFYVYYRQVYGREHETQTLTLKWRKTLTLYKIYICFKFN